MLTEEERALAKAMIDGFNLDNDVEPEGEDDKSKISFFERGNSVDESVEGLASRMIFTGHFAIDNFMISRKDGSLVEAGFGADFKDADGPVAAWIWFSRPVNAAVKAKFEEIFGGTFDEEGMRMDLDVDVFLKYSDSGKWDVFEDESADEDILFD